MQVHEAGKLASQATANLGPGLRLGFPLISAVKKGILFLGRGEGRGVGLSSTWATEAVHNDADDHNNNKNKNKRALVVAAS